MVDGTDPTEGFIVLIEGGSVGFILCYRITDDPDWKHAVTGVIGTVGSDAAIGIDYLIGDPTLTGQSLGRRMITEFVDASWARHPHADTVVVAVQQDNPPSWRALEAAAFTRVWGGRLNTADPSDQGAGYLYLRRRPPS